MQPDVPLLEYDPGRDAVIEPTRVVAPIAIAPACVLCFFHEVISRWEANGSLRLVTHLTSTIGPHAVYEWHNGDEPITLVHPGLGAPLAAMLLGQLIVPSAAVRDEGTSYHYVPPAREIMINASAVTTITATLAARDVPFRLAKTWTTDAVYRETAQRVSARKAEGCLAVEMEWPHWRPSLN